MTRPARGRRRIAKYERGWLRCVSESGTKLSVGASSESLLPRHENSIVHAETVIDHVVGGLRESLQCHTTQSFL